MKKKSPPQRSRIIPFQVEMQEPQNVGGQQDRYYRDDPPLDSYSGDNEQDDDDEDDEYNGHHRRHHHGRRRHHHHHPGEDYDNDENDHNHEKGSYEDDYDDDDDEGQDKVEYHAANGGRNSNEHSTTTPTNSPPRNIPATAGGPRSPTNSTIAATVGVGRSRSPSSPLTSSVSAQQQPHLIPNRLGVANFELDDGEEESVSLVSSTFDRFGVGAGSGDLAGSLGNTAGYRILQVLDKAQEQTALCPIYGTAVLAILLLMAAIVLIPPSAANMKKPIPVLPSNPQQAGCEWKYIPTDWSHFILAAADEWTRTQLCQPNTFGSSNGNSAGGADPFSVCNCQSPVVPTTPTEPLSWRDGWHAAEARNLALVAAVQQPLDVVLLGDSITEHWLGTEQAVTRERFQGNFQVYQEMFFKNNNNNDNNNNNNSTAEISGLALGISGDQCPHLLYRLQNGEMETNLQASVFWILIGTNDYRHALCSVDAIVAGNIRIVQEVLLRRPTATVVINSLLPRGNASHVFAWNDFRAINERLECYAASTDKVEFFNATDIFLATASTGTSGTFGVNVSLLPDGLHPEELGSRIWGQAIVDRVLAIQQQQQQQQPPLDSHGNP